jgi:glycosyltransferase involved in cell wall biosynthesis
MALKISAVTGNLGPAGAGIAEAVTGLYRAMQRADANVTIHCANAPEVDCGVRVKQHPTTGPARFAFSSQLARDLIDAEPDLVHVHGLWSYGSIAAAAWRRRDKKPVIISPHGMLDPPALRVSALRKQAALALYERHNLAHADCLHALNPEEAASIRTFGLRSAVAIVSNGVELPPNPAPRAAQNPRHLLFLGRLHPKKGLASLLRAWALLVRARPDIAIRWTLDIAGWDEGGHRNQLQALAADLALRDRVNFRRPAFGADKARVYGEASAFILPSSSEGLPITVLEAWAHGLPVLMTRACNLPIGFAARAAVEIASDPQAMAAQIANVLADEAALATMGRAGRKLAEQKFSWDEAAAKMLSVYQWLATGAARPVFVE